MDLQKRHLAQRWFVIGFVSAIFCGVLAFGAYRTLIENTFSKISNEKSEFLLGNREGAEKISQAIRLIEIKFGSGEIRIDSNSGDEINWDCDGVGKNTQLETDLEESAVRLDFSSAIVDCDITIPSLALKIEGLHGEVELRRITAPVDVHMINGELFLQPLKDLLYRYELNVESGSVAESFESSTDPKAILIKAEMKYGNIETLD